MTAPWTYVVRHCPRGQADIDIGLRGSQQKYATRLQPAISMHNARRLIRFCCRGLFLGFLGLLWSPWCFATAYGLQFFCPPVQHEHLARDMDRYLSELGIVPEHYTVHANTTDGVIRYGLNTPPGDTDTLGLHERRELEIPVKIDWLITALGTLRNILTVTEKEIVLALMQRGRLTEFSGPACTVAALRDHVGLRKNIVAWAERLEWRWPNGRSAQWNRRYWKAGTPRTGATTAIAVQDVFENQDRYAFGCYTAAKLVIVQGTLDYYRRVRGSAVLAREIEKRLLADGDPLVDIEPGKMWSFEADITEKELARPGKLLRVTFGMAPDNFVPGDWVYFFNSDPASHAKTGYEGSNPIYLGRNRFADYYNDNDHGYTFLEKLDDVYQWRHGVFSRSRDAGKIVRLNAADYANLSGSPADGGLLLPLRASPYFFGFEELPPLPRENVKKN